MPKTYELRQNELWEITTRGLSPRMKAIVNDKVQNCIKLNPYDSEYLHFELEGLRSYNKMESGNRIIFAICEECRKNGLENANNCQDCEGLADNIIILFAFGGHDTYDWLGRRRKKAWKKAKKEKRLQLRRR